MKHELEYIEDEDEQGYGDGLEDSYRCTCGETFAANGGVQEAFDHGQANPDPKPFIWIKVEGGLADWGGDTDIVDVAHVDYDSEGRQPEELIDDVRTARRIPDRLATLPHDDPRWLDRAGIIDTLTSDATELIDDEDDEEIAADLRRELAEAAFTQEVRT